MRMRSAAPAVARVASVALAAAAILLLAYTAVLAMSGGSSKRAARHAPAAVSSTVPGSVDLKSVQPEQPAPFLPAGKSSSALAALAGKWTLPSDQKSYFQFQADGSGKWVVFGTELWSGKAMPKDGTTFDLSWQGTSQTESYWQVRLTGGGKQLYFEGNQQTFVKA